MDFSKRRRVERRLPSQPVRETRTYTPEELEEARRQGTLPPGLKPTPFPTAAPNTDAVQRSLKTVEEINRINQLNQRLMEQQRRINNTK